MSNSAPDPASWLLHVLAVVRIRPGTFLGDEEVRTLRAFLEGYEGARIDMGLAGMSDEDQALLSDFTAWLKERFGHSTMDWSWIVQERFREGGGLGGARGARSTTDGSTALFFQLLEEFLAARKLRLPDGAEVLRNRARRFATFWGPPAAG